VKNFYEPDEACQEIKIKRFVADILRDGEVIEIQTRAFNNLRKKLDAFLPDYPVTVVHPIIYQKNIHYIERESGEIVEVRKSPKKGTAFDAFREIYKIKMYLKNENLSIVLLFVNAEEYRLLNKNPKYKKTRTERYDRIPTGLVGEMLLKSPEDYASILPENLPEEFTVRQLSKCAHITRGTAGIVANVMCDMGAIEHISNKGKAYIYRRKA
ncbi:MAG: hypothetical protein K6G11_09315, partial [Lachnospiraceae bacterium]|nr:hypothetical protein [Lachnospiraceae bacterium]